MRDWKTELSETCDELKVIKRKFGSKRNRYMVIIQKIIKKKYGIHIPITYYKKGKMHVLFRTIKLLQRKAFLFGYRQALEDVGELE